MSSSSTRKLKILLVGPVESKLDLLAEKLKSLQASKAGPFDACFCVGTFGTTKDIRIHKHSTLEIPLPCYIQDFHPTSNPINGTESSNEPNENGELSTTTTTTTTNTNHDIPGIVTLAPNLHWLRGNGDSIDADADAAPSADVYSIHISHQPFIVAVCPSHARMDTEATKEFQQKVGHVSYLGCDLMLTSDWPQGIDSVLAPSNNAATISAAATRHSFDTAELALRARPRYHIAPASQSPSSLQLFTQSLPFSHLQASSSTRAPLHVGRFLALANVVSTQESKTRGKAGKYVHALGIVPLAQMSIGESVRPPTTQPCPYTDAMYEKDGHHAGGGEGSTTNNNSTITTNYGMSEAQARRIIAESSSSTGDHRWKQPKMNNRKKRQLSSNSSNSGCASSHPANVYETAVVDETIVTLFVHGLHKDASGTLQTGSVALLQAFHKYNVEKVRRPPSTASYAFLEFPTHEAAKTCLEETAGEIVVAGIQLQLKWASGSGGKHSNRTDGRPPAVKKSRILITEAQAMNSSTLYFRLPPKILSPDYESATEDLRKWMERSLELALAGDDVSSEDKLMAETEPALQVKARIMADSNTNINDGNGGVMTKNYGFLEFASHAAASMALASLTSSTEGGLLCGKNISINASENKQLVEGSSLEKAPQTYDYLQGIALHWALEPQSVVNKERDANSKNNPGLFFQRQHFPPDARTDCWFCLASKACERHLIASIHDTCYIAMPKGPVDPGHILLVPVTHSSKGALGDSSVANEMEALKTKLRKHASEVYNKNLFIFERAIQTKGGYHTHVQCIPIDKSMGIKLQATMTCMAKSITGFDLKEINSDLALSSMMGQGNEEDEADRNGGYFYAEVPFSTTKYKRFLYKDKTLATVNKRAVVPLQFGREVIASVTDKPDLAHWKACVVDKEQETELTVAFRDSFVKYVD